VFNVGGPEVMVILLVALVILGPEQLPKAMRTFGNVMAEIRKVSGGFQAEMRKAMDSIEDSGSSKATPASSATSSEGPAKPLAQTPEEADVTEVVARNTAQPDDAAEPITGTAHSGHSGAVVDAHELPRVDPADRAAG